MFNKKIHKKVKKGIDKVNKSWYTSPCDAGIAQLVERQPSKLNVASSNLVSRSMSVISSVGRALDF